VGILTSE